MPLRTLTFRVVTMLALAVWIGGFTFYGGAVVPILHDELDSLQAGQITRRVTDTLNAVGLVALALGWLAIWFDRSLGSIRTRRTRVGLLATTSILSLGLVILHVVMDGRLDAGRLHRFYPLHRVYLIVSTVQWFVNLGLVAVMLVAWSGPLLDDLRSQRDKERVS